MNKLVWGRYTPLYINSKKGNIFCSGSNLHPAYKLYKYYWWVFPANSKLESAGDIFYIDKYKMTTSEYIKYTKKLEYENIPFAYVNRKLQKLGCRIWNYEQLKKDYPGIEFAPSYDDDNDKAWREYE